jgi:Cu(I)/Ag(I) efflux system membrane protein CusA/SilA
VQELRELPIVTPAGAQIPLAQVAEVVIADGAPMLKSENARLNGWTFVDIRGRDLGSWISEAKQVVREQVELPAGYLLTWSGQYEYMARAQERLNQVVPVTLAIIFLLLLLYLTFRSGGEALLVMLSLPFQRSPPATRAPRVGPRPAVQSSACRALRPPNQYYAKRGQNDSR